LRTQDFAKVGNEFIKAKERVKKDRRLFLKCGHVFKKDGGLYMKIPSCLK
jgi:hypothetical protein